MSYNIKYCEHELFNTFRVSTVYTGNMISQLNDSKNFIVFKQLNTNYANYFNEIMKLVKDGKYTLRAFLNSERISTSRTFRETEETFKLYNTVFRKSDIVIMQLFIEGIDGEEFQNIFEDELYSLEGYTKYLKFKDNKKLINAYYFDFLLIKGEEKMEYGQTKGRKVKNTVTNVLKEAVDTNKEAVKQATIVKAGKTANKTAVDLIGKFLPKKYRKMADNPFFGVLLANALAATMKQLSGNSGGKVDIVADAMIMAGYLEVLELIDINDIINKVIASVDVAGMIDSIKGDSKNSED